MKTDITYLGKIINVNSGTIEVEVSDDIPSTSPIINGKVHRIGQIGTLVKIPIGYIALYGLVSSINNVPSKENEELIKNVGSKYLKVQLLGEKLGNEKFEKGIGIYPTINDEVHIVTEEDLQFIYGYSTDGILEVGKHSSSSNLPIYLNLDKLVSRHSAIVGSTGSGKSNTTANIIKSILKTYEGSRIVLIDPHGEYSSAFPENAKVFRINDRSNPLKIPFWTMNYDELSFFLVDRKSGEERPEFKRLREAILEQKKILADELKDGEVDITAVTVDSPIPFSLKKLWYDFYRQVNATYSISNRDKQTKETEELDEEGDYEKLLPPKFKPYSPNNTAPYKSQDQTMYVCVNKIFSRIIDNRYKFLLDSEEFTGKKSEKDMGDLLKGWINHDKNLTILDLSGVPFELMDISVGLITRIIFDSMFWGKNEKFTGRNRPLLLVYEEAHSYLSKESPNSYVYGYARKAVEKIFKEGRKFGVGSMIVSQRPSEISDTILSQVGTFIALRLTNSTDKSKIQSAAPNNLVEIMDLLSSLRIGEAIISGEAIKLPTRVRMPKVNPRPDSNDPEISKSWKKEFDIDKSDYSKVVTKWRSQNN